MSISRRIDDMGRIVLPADMRKKMSVHNGDNVTISYENDSIVVRAAEKVCSICKTVEDLMTVDNYAICKNCIDKIKAID